MAENLYSTKAGVQKVIKNYYDNTIAFGDIKLQDILSTRIEQLKQLYDVVYSQELKFYNKFAITRGLEPKTALKVLQDKVADWNESGANFLVSNDAHQMVLDILLNKDYKTISMGEVSQIATELFSEGGPLYNENQEITFDRFKEVINAELEELGLAKIQKGTVNKKSGEQLYWIRFENGEIILEGKNMDPSRKKRIKKAVQSLIDKHMKKSKKTPKVDGGDSERNAALLREIILGKITNTEVRNKIAYDLSASRIGKFNLARDYGVIKGFLGEVYWSSFFRYLGASTIPVGDEKDIQSGASVAVDLLINKFGFQVKNFSFTPDGTVSFGTRGSLKDAGTFVTKRAEIDGGLKDLLLGLYGAYGFNQDVSDGEFTATRKQLEQLVRHDLDNIFDYYIDKIIHLDAEQESELLNGTNAFIPNEKTLFNAFFLIGDKIVPSSQILLTIINQLENNNDLPKTAFKTTKVKIKEDAVTYENLMSKGVDNFDQQPLKMANQVQIAYTIKLDVQTILQKAYDQALK